MTLLQGRAHVDGTVETAARARAKETLDAFWQGEGHPVDPVAIARRMGLLVFTIAFGEDVAGYLRKHPREAPRIYVNDDLPRVRRRFAFAHGLGHYVHNVRADDGELAVIDHRGPGAEDASSPEEVFANEYAAALLMPEGDVRAAFSRGERELEQAWRFAVAPETAKSRLIGLGLIHG
jgi:Zn-dependent peptidase ImmA (M78 family)